jgi:Cu+-exporting ATPase
MWLFLIATPIQFTVGWEFYASALRLLWRRTFNLDSLIVVGTTAAYLQGVLVWLGTVNDPRFTSLPLFSAAAVVLTVVSFGKWLEVRTRESTVRRWGSLAEMMPTEARVWRDGREQVIPAGMVALEDLVVVKPREPIPVDGVVVEGMSEVSEALLTGAGRPVPKVRGDSVLIASLNGSGELRVRATGVGDQTSLARIGQLVADSQTRKPASQRVADRLASVLVPVVLLLALATFAVWYLGPLAARQFPEWAKWLGGMGLKFLLRDPELPQALSTAIAVLIVACPFSLGLVTPTVVALATGLGARRGLLFRDAEALEAAARLTDVVFDKRTVFTQDIYRLETVATAPELNEDQVLALSGSLELCSEHGIAKGIVQSARDKTVVFRKVDDFALLPGRGLRGRIAGETYLLGSRAWMAERKLEPKDELKRKVAEAEDAGRTVIFLAQEDRRLLGALVVADEVPETAGEAVKELRELGVRVRLLSGDNPRAALAVGRAAGLENEEVHGWMSTEEKIGLMAKLRAEGRRVALVGEGVEEAPIMAAADVGITLGAGTELTAEASAVILVGCNPRSVAKVVRLARAAQRLIRWNLLWAFLFNLIMIPLAMLNQLRVETAVRAVFFGSVFVVINSLRMKVARVEAPGEPSPPERKGAASLRRPAAGSSGLVSRVN